MSLEQNDNPTRDGFYREFRRRTGIIRERLRRPAIYVVSYPKSGRTWIELMIARVYQQRYGIPLGRTLNYRSGPLIAASGRQVPAIRFGHGYRYQQFCQGRPFPRWFYRNARIALLTRDPRDVVVSYYHYQRYQLKSFDGTLTEFIRPQNTDPRITEHSSRCGLQPILRYHDAWLQSSASFSDFVCFRYEQFHCDAAGQLNALLSFAGVDVQPDIIDDAVAFASFSNMRQLEQSGTLSWHGLPGGSDARGFKTRSGRVGDFRHELTAADCSVLEHELEESGQSLLQCYLKTTRQTGSSAA